MEKSENFFKKNSAFWVVTLIKWLLQAFLSGKILVPSLPGLIKIFFLQRRNPRGWYSEVKQQFDVFYCIQFLRGDVLRFSIFLFKISKINNKSCLRWSELTSQSFLYPLKCAFSIQLIGWIQLFFSNLNFSKVLISK